MQQKPILLIDDDQSLTELLSEFLAGEGINVEVCNDGLSGLQLARSQNYSLILLDVMIPGLTGFEVLQALGGAHHTPIIMLTAKGEEADRVLGLTLGADDYLPKPFNPDELLARIQAIFRRIDIIARQRAEQPISLNQLILTPAKRTVTFQDRHIDLTGTEFSMLQLLMQRADQVVSKESLSMNILNRRLQKFDRGIDMHISNIRRKLQHQGKQDCIATVRGVGYIFNSTDTDS
ncbi:response regulator transcription factor [Thalassotalea mangrovi]|uniref:Response regulator transcription factor n=1 Tax=Thalassotalea mangrovi TaxID=2572245 RepID=A0A4U1B8Q8_9GAMM|nr:response regulator transcription factor [Thalassotalea mangrovi]TKB46658.1 response regulator transcription factor [Thalassotalea mangrovi]